MAIIEAKELTKAYQVPQKEPGLLGSVKSLVNRKYKTVQAVEKINITINEGELVGFIGPNGAGKTTTLKMMSGLLYPTSGELRVMNYIPHERHKEFLKSFALIMGQKQQLWWDLPLYDSLLLQRDLYEMEQADFEESLAELTELLGLSKFLKTQTRKLSLGQRMRGELAAAFIYHPKVLFLDEPTIGLDVVVQRRIRDFIKTYQKKYNATIILTSHYLDDVRELCKRLVIIDHGKIAYDGATEALISTHVDHKRISLVFSQPVLKEDLATYGTVLSYKSTKATVQVPRAETSHIAAALLTKFPIDDVSIDEPSLDDVVRELFTKKDYA